MPSLRTKMIFCLALACVFGLLTGPCLADGSRLAIGDVLGVSVDGEKEFTKTYQIGSDGCIVMPMVDPVKVEELNTTEAAAVITKALTKVLVNPQVTVTFVERAKMQVYVVGQVSKRGVVEIGVGDRVMQALAQAGYDDTADLSRVNIRRGNEIIDLDLNKYLSGDDLSVNRELQSGDTIVVPRVDMIGTVTVIGQVQKVGSVPIRRDMTFREVMGLVGDVTVEADTEKITIRRENQTEALQIDYKRAMDADPAANLVLQPGDTIYVPQIETSFYTVMGGVNRPGQYPLKGRLTLSEALGVAGGAIPHVGDLRKVRVMHADRSGDSPESAMINLTKVLEGNLPEPLVNRGDVIYVTEHKQKTNVWQIIQTVLPFGWLFRR